MLRDEIVVMHIVKYNLDFYQKLHPSQCSQPLKALMSGGFH